jgi:hypothetical protein
LEPNADVADKLRANPGEWFLVGIGTKGQEHVLSQTAYRIRQNYEQGRGLASFESDDAGRFDATASTNFRMPDGTLLACALHAVWLPAADVVTG